VEAAAEAWDLADNNADYLREYLLTLLDAGQGDQAYRIAEEQMDQEELRPWLKAVQARALAAKQQTDQAEALFDQAIRDSGSEQIGFVVRQYELAFGQDRVLQDIPEWVSMRPDDPAIRTVASPLFRGAGQLNRALPLAKEAAQLAEGDATLLLTAHIELGQTSYDLGDFPAAEVSWLKVLEIHPNNPFALNNLAYMYVADMNVPEKALPLAKRVAALMPANASILDTYGWALAQTGSYADAVNYLQRAVSLEPTPGSRYHLGRTEELRGYPDQARRQYEMALELMNEQETDDPQLRQAINQALQRVQS